MQILKGKEKDWEKCKEVNSNDIYGKGILDYIELWTKAMEEEIENNKDKSPEEVIKLCAHKYEMECDIMGLSGAAFGFGLGAVKSLWKYGYVLEPLYDGPFYKGDKTANV